MNSVSESKMRKGQERSKSLVAVRCEKTGKMVRDERGVRVKRRRNIRRLGKEFEREMIEG